ncbi:MAG: 50S ribosome-binding GTPase [Patescibacteria group bacterium]
MKKSQIAIIGRTNVGKSTLFNKLIEKRISIVSDQPNTTRDRIYGRILWRGSYYDIVDTGGINIDPKKDEQEREIYKQAIKALDESEVILFLVDGQSGLLPYDMEIASMLRKYNKKVVLVANKTEKISKKQEMTLMAEFLELGLGEPLFVSAISGRNTGDLLDVITGRIKPNEETQEEPEIKITIIGKPNVGKSSLLNSILGEEKSIVSDRPHTTRESIDSYFKYKNKLFKIVDTAGIRKTRKIDSNIAQTRINHRLTNI